MEATATFLQHPPPPSTPPPAAGEPGARRRRRPRARRHEGGPSGGRRRRCWEGAVDGVAGGGGRGGGGVSAVPNSNYVVPLDKAAPGIIRPLGEILRDLSKKVNDNIVNKVDKSIPWHHINRLLSFYAPGWSGEVRNVLFSDERTVTVVYRVTVRGSDGEAYRESSGTALRHNGMAGDPVAVAEEIAFCRACARFGLGLYLYHEDDNM